MDESGKITSTDEPVFYPVSLKKLVLFGAATYGLYYWFWAYKTNKWIEQNVDSNHHPLICAIFLPITIFGLYHHIVQIGVKNEIGKPSFGFAPPVLFFIFFLFTKAEEPLSHFYFLSLLPMVAIGSYVNTINKQLGINKVDDKISILQWIFVVPIVVLIVLYTLLSVI